MLLQVYKERKKAKTNPRNYDEAMKAVKKKFVAMKEQPGYLGSEELRMRDYQVCALGCLKTELNLFFRWTG